MNFLKRLIQHELVSGSFFISVGSVVANFLAFLLNLFLARNLTYVDYGIFASLLSMIALICVPSASINTILVRFSTDYYSKGQIDKLKSFYEISAKIIFFVSALVLLLFVIISPLIYSFLHLDNVGYLVVAGASIFIGYVQVLNGGFLQGLMKFKFMAFMGPFINIIKLVTGVMFVLLGFKAFSGLWATFFMSLGAFIVGFIPLRFIFSKITETKVHISRKEIARYAMPVFLTSLFMTSFTSTDVILVRHFFNPHDAGFYAGLSLTGRVIAYLTAPISAVMFPLLIKRSNLGTNFKNVFYLSLLLVFLPSLAITVFYFIFPNFVINFFLGGRDYLKLVPYAGFFAIYIMLISLINICVNFFLSLDKPKITFSIAIAALSQIVLIYLFHANFYQVISVLISVSLALFLVMLLYFLKVFVLTKNNRLDLQS